MNSLLLSQASVFKAARAAGHLFPAVSMATLCFSIVQILPRFTKAVPSSLVGLVVTTGLGAAMKLPLATLASSAAEGTFSGGLSSLPSLVDLGLLKTQLKSVAALKLVMPAAISIMIIALVETLLAGKVVDEMTGLEQEKDVPTRSVLAMSFGNILSSLLGGFGGCGLIPQTVLNLKSGGGGAFSSISYAVAMALFVVAFAQLVGQISQAALAGIMVTVAYDTVAWGPSANAFKAVLNPSKYLDNGKVAPRMQRVIELLALAISSGICYFGNLAVGIIAGVAFQRGMLSVYKRFGSGGDAQLKVV
jgi:SulP family sulfate permease